MPTTLFLSAYPGDAVLAVGALMASLPAGSAHHATIFPSTPSGSNRVQAAGQQDFAQQALALTTLGVSELPGALADAASGGEGATDRLIHDRLAAYFTDLQPDAVLLPLGLAQRPGDLQLTEVALRLRQEFYRCRWLQYFDQPFVALHRGQFPELAFARRVRGIAEVDEDASMFNWKPTGSSMASPDRADPLSRKLTAAGLLDGLVTQRYFTRDDDADGFATTPNLLDPEAGAAFLQRSLGQREWLRLLHD